MTAFGIALQKAHSHRTISGFEKYLWRYQTVVGPQMEIANVTFRLTFADFTELFAKTGRTVIVALGCARGCARAADKCLGKHNLSGRGVAGL